MLTLLTKLRHPALTDIELQLNSSNLKSNRQLEFYPNVISDLYKDEPLVLSYRLNGGIVEAGHSLDSGSSLGSGNDISKINLKAQYQQQAWENSLELNAQTRQSGLNVLWARERISQLTRDKRRVSMRPSSTLDEQNEYQSQITKTALAHHLVSQYTSLVAVDVTPTRPADVQSNTRKVADPVPKGTSNQLVQTSGSLPQTATSALLKIIVGFILIGLAICMHLLTKRKVVF